MVDLATRTYAQLPPKVVVEPTDLIGISAPDGPMSRVPVQEVFNAALVEYPSNDDLGASSGAARVGSAGGRNTQLVLNEALATSFSLRRFGDLVGQGNASYDTGAFLDLIEAQLASRIYVDTDYSGHYPFTMGFVPPGKYKLSAAIGAGLGGVGLWCHPGSVTLVMDADEYFLDVPDFLDFTYVSGFRLVGGKGLLRHSFTGVNVSHQHIVQYNVLDDYTRCGIVSEAADMPYWRIRDNEFRCKQGGATFTKGVVLGGLLDNDLIENNAFENNDIHIQLQVNSGSIVLRNNSFLSLEPDRCQIDIWGIPNDVVGNFGTNSGPVTVESNKIGNELRGVASQNKPRIEFSVKSGATRELAVPDHGWKSGSDGSNWMSEWRFIGNSWFNYTPSGDGIPASLIDNYLDKLTRCYWDAGNTMEGGRLDNLVRHVDGGARVTSAANTGSLFDIGPGMHQFGSGSSFRKGVSSHPMGLVRDLFGMESGPHKLLPSPDPGEIPLAFDASATNWGAEAGIGTAPALDRLGNNNAIAVTWTVAGRYIYLLLPDLTAIVGQMAWVALDFWGAADIATKLQVLIQNSADAAVSVNNAYRPTVFKDTLYVPFFVAGNASPTSWQMRVTAPVIAAGADQAVLGEARVVAARHAPAMGRYPKIAAPVGGAVVDVEARAAIAGHQAALQNADAMHL